MNKLAYLSIFTLLRAFLKFFSLVDHPFTATQNLRFSIIVKSVDIIKEKCDLPDDGFLSGGSLANTVYGLLYDVDTKFDDVDIFKLKDIVGDRESIVNSKFFIQTDIKKKLTRDDDDDPLFVTNKIGYVNRISAAIGRKLLKRFGPDYIYNKYRERQLEICNILDVEPSNCVLFGIGGNKWYEYNRDRDTNRLSFHKYLNNSSDDELRNIADEKR